MNQFGAPPRPSRTSLLPPMEDLGPWSRIGLVLACAVLIAVVFGGLFGGRSSQNEEDAENPCQTTSGSVGRSVLGVQIRFVRLVSRIRRHAILLGRKRMDNTSFKTCAGNERNFTDKKQIMVIGCP